MSLSRWIAALALAAMTTAAPAAEPAYTVLLRVPFLSGSDQLGPLARARLDRVIPALKSDYADSGFELAGHTDDLGGKSHNQDLSLRRARAVYDYLSANGVDVRYVYARGYGETEPLAGNDTREGRFRNRRVELRLRRGAGPGEITHR